MLSSSKYTLLFILSLLAFFQSTFAAETLCRKCSSAGVSYTFDSPLGHFEASAKGAACLQSTSARSIDGTVFQDYGQDQHTFSVSGRGWTRSCTTQYPDRPCCIL